MCGGDGMGGKVGKGRTSIVYPDPGRVNLAPALIQFIVDELEVGKRNWLTLSIKLLDGGRPNKQCDI